MSELQIFPTIDRIVAKLNQQKKIAISGLFGSALSLFIFELSKKVNPVIFVTAPDKIERFGLEIAALVPESVLIDEKHPYFCDAAIITTTMEYFEKEVKTKEQIRIAKNNHLCLDDIVQRLEATGFTREEIVEDEFEYAVRGGIVDVYEPEQEPFRIEFEGDVIRSIRKINPQTQRSIDTVEEVMLKLVKPESAVSLLKIIAKKGVLITERNLDIPVAQIVLQDSGDFTYRFSPVRKYFGDLKVLQEDLHNQHYRHIFLVQTNTAQKLFAMVGPVETINLPINEGFIDEDKQIVFLAETDVFGTLPKRKQTFKGLFLDDLKGLKIDDYVVHNDYGIGQFKGLVEIDYEGKKVECLYLNYADSAKVYLPAEKLNLLERYIGSEDKPPKLSKIGSDLWFKTKQKVRRATEILAHDLLNLYARRQQSKGFTFSADGFEIKELELGFGYEETPDQAKAIADVKKDMESPKPQERLICGDVGFGKTEIALRAAFKAALDGKQTMFLCPTTLLAFQHYNTFSARLRNFPITVDMASRFKRPAELKKMLKGIQEGSIDIAIGTHRLLHSDVVFKDLGLLIIDEEQRFGVMQKDRIKRLKPGIDVIYLSATPIPRTLYLGLAGLKDISVIHTPPTGRKDIITQIIHFDDDMIRSIIQREIDRHGQIFFVHNRIQTIEAIRHRLQGMLPNIRICLLHGKIDSVMSEKKMLGFLEGKYDLLLSTAIIESGLDMPHVNTILVNEAHNFGLADLHQLRGRVGRADIQGYAYFIVPAKPLTDKAKGRLSALVSYTTLGSGFRLAIRDMEIRGVGNILGKEQSGFVNSIGYHHYVKMLQSAVNEIQGKEVVAEPLLNLSIPGYIPSEYIQSPYERTAIYKRLMDIQTEYELASLKEEIMDRFGKYPESVDKLFLIAKIRLLAIGINATEALQSGDSIKFYHNDKIVKQITCKDL